MINRFKQFSFISGVVITITSFILANQHEIIGLPLAPVGGLLLAIAPALWAANKWGNK